MAYSFGVRPNVESFGCKTGKLISSTKGLTSAFAWKQERKSMYNIRVFRTAFIKKKITIWLC
jgi:hypothetical protein